MPSLTLTLETVTPLLMNGADQMPEVRAASFRGVLRYWLRAVLGGTYQGDIGGLKAEESRHFGSTEAGSPMRVRVEHSLSARDRDTEDYLKHHLLPPRFEFPGYQAKQRFSLIFDTHPLHRGENVFTQAFYAALLLAFNLGAFGKRARRGGGVLQVVSSKADFAIDEQFESYIRFRADDHDSLADFLDACLVPFVSRSQGHPASGWIALPSYPVWHPEHVKVLVGPTGYDDDPKLRNRQRRPPYAEGYRTALQEAWDISGNLGMHDMKDAWGYAKGGRRASAVHMRVHLGADGLYYPLITMFRSSSVDPHSSHTRDVNWGKLEDFERDLLSRGYRRLAFCTGVWS